ncbi:MAG TPA: SRPBCC domain-containing protein [Planctomycetota bacterium]|nr:SRPBCC domain-containing protein [Planctomycetota bacterium]
MTREIRLDATYPHPPDRVWRAITTREALASWLMPNDFEPRVGHRFTFRMKPVPGFDGIVHCEVIELEPPRRLSFRWKGGPLDTVVSFELAPVPEGTRLELVHDGFTGPSAAVLRMMMKPGWKKMLRKRLPPVIAATAGLPAPSAADCEGSVRNRFLGRIAIWLHR